ncbi:MAG: O-antigen ligase family protein, partial [Alphaproteobacteria bacterium]|nr:O-antigen ligase family protein [Alphaproteobacteria bacterium]
SMNSYNKGVSNLILLLIPAIGYFGVKRSWAWCVIGIVSAIIFALVSSNSTAKVALFIALLTIGIATLVNIVFNPLWLRLLIGVKLSLIILLAPLWVRVLTHYEGVFVKLGIKLTFLVRLEIWNLVNRGIWAHPWIGHGWRSSRALSLNSVTSGKYVYLNQMGSDFHFYPHNQMLQIWYDLGIGGALIAAGLVIWIALRLGKLPRELQASALAAMVFVLTTSIVNYDLATDAWWAILAAVAGLFLLAAEGVIEARNPAQIETIFSRPRQQKFPDDGGRANSAARNYESDKNAAHDRGEDNLGWR